MKSVHLQGGKVQLPMEMDTSKTCSKDTQAAHGHSYPREEWQWFLDFSRVPAQIVLTCPLLPKPDLECLQETNWNHCTSPVGHSPTLGSAPPDAAQVQSNLRSSIISAGNGVETTGSTTQSYLLQMCLLHKNPPVVPLTMHPCQRAEGLSIPNTKTETWASEKTCFKITGHPVLEDGTCRAAQGWQAAALTITQLGPLEEGRSEVEVASASPSRSEINPVEFLKTRRLNV